MKKNKIVLVLTLCIILLLFAFTGCGESYAGGADSQPGNGGTDSKYDIVITEDRLIVYNVNMSLTVGNTTETLRNIKEDLREAGGYEESSSQNNSGYARCVLRVPTEKLAAFLNQLETFGTVNNCEISSEDITEQYESTAAKKEVLLRYKEMLEQQLDATVDISEKQSIMKELSQVAADIDRYDSELAGYKKRADYSTVVLRLYGENLYQEPSYWEQLGEVFFGSTSSLGTFCGVILKIAAAVIPYAALAAAVFGLVVLVIFIVCKIRKKPFDMFARLREERELKRLEKQYKSKQKKERLEMLKNKLDDDGTDE